MGLLQKLFGKIKSPQIVLENTLGTAIIAATLLVIPLAAKVLSKEFEWSGFDFFAAWMLFFSAGLTYRLVARKMKNNMYKAAVGLAVATGLFLVWSNLAVGLIGSEDNPANLMYLGVIAISFLGAIIARFKPEGMTKVLFALAASHALIAAAALIMRLDLAPESFVAEILAVNGFFAVLWTGSALLFRNVAIDQKNESRTISTT